MKKTAAILLFFILGVFLFVSTAVATDTTVFGPEKFVRTKGKTDLFINSFSAHEDKARLVIRNGDPDGKNRVSSATIAVNGIEIFKTSDFNQQVDVLEAPVNLFMDNSISVELNSSPGSFLAIQVLQTSAFNITITSPANNAVINNPYLMVRGTVQSSTGNEVGVTVNSYPAQVSGGEFFANNIPLVIGENTLKAVATEQSGATITTSVKVYLDTTISPDWIKLIANPMSGIAPLKAKLYVKRNLTFSPASSSLTYQGPGNVTITPASDTEYDLIFSSPGIYVLTYTVSDPEGNPCQGETMANIFDRDEIDATLKSVWSGMKTAMSNGDVEGAVSYISEGKKAVFREIYSNLQERLPTIASNMQEIELIELRNDMAEYRLKKNMTYQNQPLTATFYLYFKKDWNGLWKIWDY